MTSQPIASLSDSTGPYFMGVDLGGTSVKIGLIDNEGRTLAFASIPTREEAGPQQAVDRMALTAKALLGQIGLGEEALAQVGLGSPGTMCLQKGILVEPPNLPKWYGFPIRDALAKAVGKPVSFINDANAAAYGEFWIGTGSAHQNLVMLTLGTGVGGGIIHEGRLINGVNSAGSECGHMIVDSSPDARLCVWGGGKGELEAYASASAVARRAVELAAANKQSRLSTVLRQNGTITAKNVYEAALVGDALALEIIDEVARYLAIGIHSIVSLIDPGLVVLGGAMSFGGRQCAVGQRFLGAIRRLFAESAFTNVVKGTKIEFASLGGDAGYIGAAGIAKSDYQNRIV
jgi:glucokinase